MGINEEVFSSVDILPVDVESMVKECCATQVPVLLVFHDSATFIAGRFDKPMDGQLVLQVKGEQDLSRLAPPAMCTATFHYLSRLNVFLSRLHEYVPGPTRKSPGRLVVGYPMQITGQDARLAERLPVPKELPIQVNLTIAGIVYPVKALNVSMCGVLVHVPQLQLELETELLVELRLDGAEGKLRGVVRRHGGPNRYGIFFPDTVRGEVIHPPAVLRRIVHEIERSQHFSVGLRRR